MKTVPNPKFWRRTDYSALVKTILIGLVVGVTVRWMSVSAPPLSALAHEPESAAAAPAAAPSPETAPVVRSGDASPSARR